MTGPSTPGWLSATDWSDATQKLPIACVDVVPVIRDGAGEILRIGLIRRRFSKDRIVWCHVGGRVYRDELLADAASRHLAQSLTPAGPVHLAEQPFYVSQYLTHPGPGAGFDPTKHSIASCFLADFDAAAEPTGQGEAIEFRWFDAAGLPAEHELWPGCALMLERIPIQPRWNDEMAQYAALSDREIAHNTLMWQTPGLALTAMAFLLTIALGGSRPWERSLAGFLSALVAVISVQLMTRHSIGQIADAEALLTIERRRGMLPAHSPLSQRPTALVPRHAGLSGWLATKRSRNWWIAALELFALVSAVVGVLAAFGV